MRYFLCVVFLVLCLVAWECTANSEGLDGQQLEKGGGGVTETTAPKKDSPGPQDQPLGQGQQNGAQAQRGEEVGGQKEDGDDNDGQEIGERDSHSGPQERTVGVVDPLQTVVTTTTTTTQNKGTVEVPKPPAGDGRLSPPEEHSPLEAPKTEDKLGASGQITDGSEGAGKVDVKTTTTTTAPAPGVQKDVIPLTGEKTTTTAAVQTLSGSPGEKVKDQSTPPKDGDAPDHTMTDAAAAAITTTTSTPVNILPKQSTIQQSVNIKDSSSSTSLLVAFATLATLAVILVLPV